MSLSDRTETDQNLAVHQLHLWKAQNLVFPQINLSQSVRMRAMKNSSTVVPGWLRAVLSFVLIFSAVLLTPNAVIASWLKSQITDTSNFVEMTTEALQNPAVEQYVSDEVSTIIIDALDIDALTSELFSGLESALPLGEKAAGALSLLEKPLANGAKSMIVNVTDKVVKSEAFDTVTTQVLTMTHKQVMSLLRGDTTGAIVADENGVLGIQVGPIVEAVKKELVKQGVGLAERIPNVDATIEIGKVDGLVEARIALSALDAAGYWLAIIVLIMLVAGILFARQRARATVWAGIGVVISTGALLSGISVGKYAFLATVSPQVMPSSAAGPIFTALTERLNQLLTATLIIGLMLAIVAYLVGPFRGAVIVRSAVTDTAGRVRAIAADKGVTTGAFGTFVERAHNWIIGVILGGTALILFLLRPFTVNGAIWAAVIALVLVLIVQLVRRPEEGSAAGSEDSKSEKPKRDKPKKKVSAGSGD